MNARVNDASQLRAMRQADIEVIAAIEQRAYPFPWTPGIFRDCLRVGHECWVLDCRAGIIGYGVLSCAAGEAHVLNVCIAPEHQGHGHGRHLLRRLVARTDDVAYAPLFVREREEAVAGALPVSRDVPLVVTEGNYLLADGEFAPVRELLTECWYLDCPDRRERLLARHVRHGRSPEAAAAWVARTDDVNARLVEQTRSRADLVVRLA